MTGQTGLRRFVRPAAGGDVTQAPRPPAAAPLALSKEAVSAMGQLPGQRAAPGQQADAPERCELCANEVALEHGHIADLQHASLMCACRACYLLFTQRSAGGGRFMAVPDRYLHDADRVMSPADWDQLEIPVGLAFFLRTSRDGGQLTGFYPSPAGVTECRLDLQLWDRLKADYPLLGAPADDVEAALISRSDDGVAYYLVPVDACYELAGRMRLHWQGFDGGAEARASIAAFLAEVRHRARRFSPED
ncbi:MAG TPA: DUF5947 family protein [Streptosporangiaceae bacterium]|nr:DUF5947 family protein [Streptosporangiaceae bacterium]